MDFQAWATFWGNNFQPEALVRIKQWNEKGVGAEWAAEYFLRSKVVNVAEVDRVVAHRSGTSWLNVEAVTWYDPSFWVLKLKDGRFQLVVNTLYSDDSGDRRYEPHIVELARGNSLEECLGRAWPDLQGEVYEELLRSGRAKGLNL